MRLLVVTQRPPLPVNGGNPPALSSIAGSPSPLRWVAVIKNILASYLCLHRSQNRHLSHMSILWSSIRCLCEFKCIKSDPEPGNPTAGLFLLVLLHIQPFKFQNKGANVPPLHHKMRDHRKNLRVSFVKTRLGVFSCPVLIGVLGGLVWFWLFYVMQTLIYGTHPCFSVRVC